MRKPVQAFLLLLVVGLLAGCHRAQAWMPLENDKQWTYHMRTGFDQYVEGVGVTRRISVAETDGVELLGPMGVSRLAWDGNTLFAGEFSNVTFLPPLPLLSGNAEITLRWKGVIRTLAGDFPSECQMTQQPEAIEVNGLKFDTLKATHQIRMTDRSVELTTWFAEGRGIVRQEQHTNGKRDFILQILQD